MRILFVCLGNICRSPTAEAVLRARMPDWKIDSAGTSAWHIGNPPYGPMQAAAKSAGYQMNDLRARQIESGDFDRFDLIIGMDAENLQNIKSLRPTGDATPVRSLADYVDDARDIPDPYYSRDFSGALALIERCVDGLIAQERQ